VGATDDGDGPLLTGSVVDVADVQEAVTMTAAITSVRRVRMDRRYTTWILQAGFVGKEAVTAPP
jgi:hypothetical protein